VLADEQPRTDLGVREAVAGQPRDLSLLRGELILGPGVAFSEVFATGERARKRTVETRDDLTAREAQIARLAAEGLSSAEIGSRLFISQHTVAYHLRKVFAKLDISSRNQLVPALPQGA
jgi:DNA-binding CsgD family transcriptional regulator